MIVLGIDTTGGTSSAAVLTPAGVECAVADEPRGHARVLPGLIASACGQAGVRPNQVTHVAVGRGPGLFTGMRVGLVTAQMIALADALPLAGVSTLEALARRVVVQYRPTGQFAVLIDARRREVFAAVFDTAGTAQDQPRALSAATLRGPGGIPADVADEALFVDTAAASLALPGTPVSTGGLAVEVAALAAARWLAGQPQDPATPLYLRRPDTTAANPARSVLGRP